MLARRALFDEKLFPSSRDAGRFVFGGFFFAQTQKLRVKRLIKKSTNTKRIEERRTGDLV